MLSVQFLVHETHFEGNEFVVGGIVSLGTVIQGMTFTLLRSEGLEMQEVRFLVRKILAYRHEFEELPKGISGALFLVGEGVENIKKHDKLEFDGNYSIFDIMKFK